MDNLERAKNLLENVEVQVLPSPGAALSFQQTLELAQAHALTAIADELRLARRQGVRGSMKEPQPRAHKSDPGEAGG